MFSSICPSWVCPIVLIPQLTHTLNINPLFLIVLGGHSLDSRRGDKVRIFRAEKQYAVTSGKWYFEFEAVTTGEMRVGWARPNVRAGTELGADELAYVFNGNRVYNSLCNLFCLCPMGFCVCYTCNASMTVPR